MSLLDDVSIVVTPNGYKAGTLYGVLPTATEGTDLVTNGGFDTDSNWNGSGSNGWTISGGKASNDGTVGSNNLSQSGILEVDKRYKIDITVSNYVSGNVEVSAGASPRGTMTANGTYTFYQTCTPSTTFYIIANSFDGSVDNVSVKEWTASDMDVTRATAATRVDENGLVNYAEVLGSELVSCGSFDCADPDAVWSRGTGWTIANGVAEHDGSGGGNLDQTMDITNGYVYKVTFTILNSTQGSLGVYLSGGFGGNFSNGTHTIYITGGSASSYDLRFVPISSFIGEINNVSVKEADRNNVPRIDYTGGGCPHILAEPQRTNLIPFSEDFNGSVGSFSYSKVGGTTVTPNSIIAPDGTNTGTLVTKGTNDLVIRANSVVETNKTYTFSCYVKSSGSGITNISIDITDDNLTSFTLTNDWQRISVTAEVTRTPQSTFNFVDMAFNGSQGDTFYTWGWQVEEGSYATSYIPTSGSTVTRNQDIFTRDGIGSLINSTEGVLFVEIASLSNDGTYREISLNDGTTNNVVEMRYTPTDNQFQFVVRSAGSVVVNFSLTLSNALDFNKFAISFKLNDFKMYVNGVQVSTDTSGAVPTGMDTLSLDWGGTNNFYGKVKQLQVYDTALTDSQLTSLTT